jgi:hypothetical protein
MVSVSTQGWCSYTQYNSDGEEILGEVGTESKGTFKKAVDMIQALAREKAK